MTENYKEVFIKLLPCFLIKGKTYQEFAIVCFEYMMGNRLHGCIVLGIFMPDETMNFEVKSNDFAAVFSP